MSNRLEAVKAQFDAMIAQLKEEVSRQVDLKMEVLLEMWREEMRLKKKKKPTRGQAVKRMRQNKVAEDGGGQQSDDNADSMSVKSEIELDECGCDSDGEDYSNLDVKEELSDEEDAVAPIASTSRGQKRQAIPACDLPTKRRRITPVDNQDQESTSASGSYKVLSIDCTVEACKLTFRCVHKMREHLLAVHQVKPFPCRAQGCDQQFDKK